jgi:dsDNA-specific endonuclease/ATPase MutS2
LRDDGSSLKSEKTAKDLEKMFLEKESAEEDKSKRYSARQERKTIEVDLHINELVESVVGMTNAEILEQQMKVFHQTMTDAIMSNAGKVIFIHGIGNGTLKATIRESLAKQYKVIFEDASFREYGFGATMVLL